MSSRVAKLFQQMQTLEATLHPGEGATSLTLYADLSWKMTLNMWGVAVASCCNYNTFDIDLTAVRDSNPHWVPEVEIIVSKLNKQIDKFVIERDWVGSAEKETEDASGLSVVSVFLVMQFDPPTCSDSLLDVYLDRERAKAFAATHTHGPNPVRVEEWKDGSYGPLLR